MDWFRDSRAGGWRRFAATLLLLAATPALAAAPRDLSGVRGFNYTPASVDDEQTFFQYDDREVNRDFGYARSLGLNQARIFVREREWAKDPARFRASFASLLAALRAHDLQVMFVLSPNRSPAVDGSELAASTRTWLDDLMRLTRGHREVLAWDVANEPDWPGFEGGGEISPDKQAAKLATGRALAALVHAADKRNLTTVGCWSVRCIASAEPFTDIISYHDYSPTRPMIDANAAEAKAFAAKVGKPVVQTEVGCVGRGSPYDMVLREYRKAGMGFYIWELMVTKMWGNIHGIFYPDGTVRDPAIAAAVMGIFRNEGPTRVLEVPDRESWVTTPLQRGAKWLAAAEPDWNEGLEIAETEANMLEANQLVPMRDPPSLTILRLRAGPPDLAALRAAMQDYQARLTPYAGLGRLHGN